LPTAVLTNVVLPNDGSYNGRLAYVVGETATTAMVKVRGLVGSGKVRFGKQ